MITVGMNYRVIESKQGEFEAVFGKVLQIIERSTGHVRSALYKDVNDGASYLIHSEWNDRGAFEAFIASPQFKGVADWGKSRILAARPHHEIYEGGAVGAQRPALTPPPPPAGRCPAGSH